MPRLNAAISSLATALNRKSPAPAPPNSSGTASPRIPSEPASSQMSRGMVFAWSISSWRGLRGTVDELPDRVPEELVVLVVDGACHGSPRDRSRLSRSAVGRPFVVELLDLDVDVAVRALSRLRRPGRELLGRDGRVSPFRLRMKPEPKQVCRRAARQPRSSLRRSTAGSASRMIDREPVVDHAARTAVGSSMACARATAWFRQRQIRARTPAASIPGPTGEGLSAPGPAT